MTKQRSGWFLETNGNRVIQAMQRPDGVQKGVRTILQERGLWNPELKLNEARERFDKQEYFCFPGWLDETLTSEKGFLLDFTLNFIVSSIILNYVGALPKTSHGEAAATRFEGFSRFFLRPENLCLLQRYARFARNALVTWMHIESLIPSEHSGYLRRQSSMQ